MEQRRTVITLGVSDLKRTTDIYEKTFGWKKSELSNEYISFFTLNGIQLSPYERNELAKDATANPNANGFIGFTISYNTKPEKEVDQLITELRAKGIKIIKEPYKVNWGGHSSYVSDKDGNLWEIAVVERAKGILKDEFYLDQTFFDVKHAIRAAKNAIKLYNSKRLHLSLDF